MALFLLPIGLRLHALVLLGVAGYYAAVKYAERRSASSKDVSELPQVLAGLAGLYAASWLVLLISDYGRLGHLVTTLALPAFVFLPVDYFGRNARRSFLRVIQNIRTPSFDSILLADIATSYAKVLADWDILLFCYILKPLDGLECGAGLLSVLLMCVPYGIRFSHCLQEVARTQQWQHAINAAKYFFSFPLIYVTFLKHPATPLLDFVILLSFALNCSWDLSMDWRISSSDPFYLFAAPLNILVRFIWSLRLYHLLNYQHQAFWNASAAVFVVQALEIGRRMVWVVGRMEREKGTHFPLHH